MPYMRYASPRGEWDADSRRQASRRGYRLMGRATRFRQRCEAGELPTPQRRCSLMPIDPTPDQTQAPLPGRRFLMPFTKARQGAG